MNSEFKAHPLMILSEIKPFLFVLILPLTRVVLQYFIEGETVDIFGFEGLLLCTIMIVTVFRWRYFCLLYNNGRISIKKGFILTSCAEIYLKDISCIEVRQNLIDLCFSCVTYCINTEAGGRKRANFKFKLKSGDARRLSVLLYGEENFARMSFSPVKTAVWAISTSSVSAGLIIGFPILNNVGRLLDLALSELILKKLNQLSGKTENFFPPAVNAVTVILLLAYLFSFVYGFIKYIKFSLYTNSRHIKVYSGFFVRSKSVFLKRAINDIKIEQTPIMMLFKRYSVKADVAGFGTRKDEGQIISLSATKRETKKIKKFFFPSFVWSGEAVYVEKKKKVRNRFFFFPTLLLIAIPTVCGFLGLIFTKLSGLILFIAFISLFFVFYSAYINSYEYRNAFLKIDESLSVCSTKRFKSCSLFCKKENIGEIKLREYFTDKKRGSCRIIFKVASKNRDKIRIRHLNADRVKGVINKTFNTDV